MIPKRLPAELPGSLDVWLMISGMGWDKVKQALEIEKKLGMEHLSGPEKGQKIRKLRNQFIQEFGKDSVIRHQLWKGKI